MDKERQMGTQDDWESLSEVPVPRMRAIKRSQILQHVEFQEVQLNQYPLGDGGELNTNPKSNPTATLNYTVITGPV